MTYRILFDYGTEGMSFLKKVRSNEAIEFDTVDEAITQAIGLNCATPFLLVNIINWKAVEKDDKPEGGGK